MARDRGPGGLLWLVAAVVAGTAVVVAVTLALYPGDRPVAAAVPTGGPSSSGSASGPSVNPSPSATAPSGTDARGCPVAFTAAPDDHLLCPPDLGSGWRLDPASAVRPVSEICAPSGAAPARLVASSRVLSMLGPGFDVVEQVRQYGSVADATAAFDALKVWMLGCTGSQTGLQVRDADNEVVPASLSGGFVSAQSWWVIQNRLRAGLVLFQVGSSVVEVAVLPHDATSGAPQASLVNAIAHAALQWDSSARTPTPSASAASGT